MRSSLIRTREKADFMAAQLDAWLRTRWWVAPLVLTLAWLGMMLGGRVSHPSGWWFEDDPLVYLRAVRAGGAWRFFADPEFTRGASAHNEFGPFCYFWYWLDSVIAWREPMVCYATNAAAFLAATLLLNAVLARYLGSAAAALAGTLVWLALPSTLVTASWLTTSYYMRGLCFALLALLAAHAAVRTPRASRRSLALLIGAGYCAVLSKEFFVTALPTFLFLYFAWHRRWALTAVPVAIACVYAVHRVALVGFGLKYDQEYVSAGDYLRFLEAIPYIFSGNHRGYRLLAAIGVTVLIALLRPPAKPAPAPSRAGLALLAATLVVSVGVLTPIAGSILANHALPGTWYRSLFVVNTVIVAVALWASLRARSWALALVLAYLSARAIPKGSVHALVHFHELMHHNEAEGKFILSRPRDLLYATTAAPWFIGAVAELYADQSPGPFIRPEEIQTDKARQLLAAHATAYRFKLRGIEEDRGLYARLRELAESPTPMLAPP